MKLAHSTSIAIVAALLACGVAMAQSNPNDRDTTVNTGGPKGTSGTVGPTERAGPTTGDAPRKSMSAKKRHHTTAATSPASGPH
ncbi:MAG: hypothetical protein WA840_18530 [Caulobacteraceae bacterium]